MSNGKLLKQLIRSGAEGDLDAFRGVAKQVIVEERQKQHHLLADEAQLADFEGAARQPRDGWACHLSQRDLRAPGFRPLDA